MDMPVHDIAPLLEVKDYSFYWFILLIMIVLVGVLSLGMQMKIRKRPIVENKRRMKYEALTRIDMNDAKAAAYAISEQGLFFIDDSNETRSVYERLFERLEQYKYAPVVEAMDEETLDLYRLFLQKIEN
jgi:hypothetical protein